MNKIVFADFEEEFSYNNLEYAVVSYGGNFGAINKFHDIIIPFQYSNLIDFDDQLLLACNKENLWGFINWKNEIIIPFQYTYASVFSEDYNLSQVCKNSKYGYINRSNQEIVPIVYNSVTNVKSNKLGVCKNQKWGIINLQNKLIIDYKYDFAMCITEGIFWVGNKVNEKIEDYDLERDLLTFQDGELLKFGLIDEKENILMDYESYATTDFYGNSKVLAFDYPQNENYIFDIISKERIYAPKEMDEDGKSNFLKTYLTKRNAL